MGFYGDQVLPRCVNLLCASKIAREQRARVCAGLAGEVVEIGFGSGHNVPHYPRAVTGVAAVEPADVAWELAEQRVRATTTPVRRAGLDGQSLPFEDDALRRRALDLDDVHDPRPPGRAARAAARAQAGR